MSMRSLGSSQKGVKGHWERAFGGSDQLTVVQDILITGGFQGRIETEEVDVERDRISIFKCNVVAN